MLQGVWPVTTERELFETFPAEQNPGGKPETKTPRPRGRGVGCINLERTRRGGPPWSAVAAGQDAEERLDVGVGADVAVAVKVGGGAAGRGRAVAAQAGEEGLDVEVGADVTVAVEVGAAALAGAGDLHGRG